MSMTSLHNDDVPEGVQPLMGVAFSDLGRQLVLCRLPCAIAISQRVLEQKPIDAPSWQRLAADSCGRVESLQRLLLHADIGRLRSVLAHEERFVHRLSDYQVREAVAHLVQRGVVGLFERVGARGMAGAAPAPLRAAAVSQARRTATLPSSAAAFPARDPSPAPSTSPAPTRLTAPVRHWIAIELVGEDGRAVADEAYSVRLPGGRLVEGRLDSRGSARIEDIESAGQCRVSFPDLDGAAWEVAAQ